VKFLAETKEFLADAETLLESFEKSEQYFSDLFSGVGQIYSSAEDEEEESSDSLLSNLTENVGNYLFVDEDER
jgi:hypothetical protein